MLIECLVTLRYVDSNTRTGGDTHTIPLQALGSRREGHSGAEKHVEDVVSLERYESTYLYFYAEKQNLTPIGQRRVAESRRVRKKCVLGKCVRVITRHVNSSSHNNKNTKKSRRRKRKQV